MPGAYFVARNVLEWRADATCAHRRWQPRPRRWPRQPRPPPQRGVAAVGFELGDPLIGLAITLAILRITWQSFVTLRQAPDPEADDGHGPTRTRRRGSANAPTSGS